MPRILLVEDNEMNRDMLSRRLARRGFDVTLAVDGPGGLDAAKSGDFDLILMDLSLPGIDGWEVIRRVRSDPLTVATPIIALTAHAMAGDRERAIAAGCDEYDTKPVEFSRLIAKIAALLPRGESPPIRDRPPFPECDYRRFPHRVRFHLMISAGWIWSRNTFLTQEAESRGRPDLLGDLRSIRTLVTEVRRAIDRAMARDHQADRPIDLASLVPALLTSAHAILRSCDSLEGSLSRTPDRVDDFPVHLSEIRKDASELIAIAWQASPEPDRSMD